MSYVFDGTDYITYPHSGGLTGFAPALTNCSLSAWVKWDGGAGGHTIFQKANPEGWFRWRLGLQDGGKLWAGTRDVAAGGGETATGQISTGAWTHVFFAFNKAGGTACWRIWVNAVEKTTTCSAPDSSDLNISSTMMIGAYTHSKARLPKSRYGSARRSLTAPLLVSTTVDLARWPAT